jgi:hypothetical protein
VDKTGIQACKPVPSRFIQSLADPQATWVPHAWLLATTGQKLRNFLDKGVQLDLITDESLAAKGDDMEAPTVAKVLDEEDLMNRDGAGRKSKAHHHVEVNVYGRGPPPDVNGESSIPNAWRVSQRNLLP